MNTVLEKTFLKKSLSSITGLQELPQLQFTEELLQDQTCRKLFEIASWYYTKYQNLVSADTLKLLLDKSTKIDAPTRERVFFLYTELQSTVDPLDQNIKFVVDQLKDERRKDLLKETLLVAANNFESGHMEESLLDLKKGINKIELNIKEDIKEGFLDESTGLRWDRYQDIKNNPDKFKGIPIGFPSLDITTNGIRPGQLMVVIAGVKEGKSTFLLNAAYHASILGYKVLYVSVEMPKEQIERRYDSRDSGLSYSRIRDGRLSPDEERIYKECITRQKNRPGKFYTLDAHQCSTPYLKSKLMSFPYKFDLVVVDYLTLLQSAKAGSSSREMWQTVGDITYEVRDIARELNIPIITAAQANRDGMKESKYKYGVENIGLSHLISAHADTLISLRLVDRDELEINDVVEMTAATIAVRDDKACRFTLDAAFDKMLLCERQMRLTGDTCPSRGY